MTKNYRKTVGNEASGTCLRGYVDITYGGLVQKLGKPHYRGDSGDKTHIKIENKKGEKN